MTIPSDREKVSIADVAHGYTVAGGWRPVLAPLSLDIFTGDTVGIIGPTGVGKSTLLRILAGFERPALGNVRMRHGQQWDEVKTSAKTGYLFQQPNLFPWLTIEDNVRFGARHARVYPDARSLSEVCDALIDSVRLGDARRLYPYQVSGGMRARAAVARVFLTRPELLLMDEPFGALDALTRRDMYVLLRELMAQTTELTTLMITHDVDEAITLCNRILVMTGSPGRVSASVHTDLHRRVSGGVALHSEPEYAELRATLLELLSGGAGSSVS